MTVNDSCVPGNSTCSTSGSSVGLTVGLTLFFLLLIIVAGVFAYKYRSRIMYMLQFVHRRSEKNEDYVETPEANVHQCREQPTTQTPIYENLTPQTTGFNRHSVKESRLSGEPEEDLYLQCDIPDADDAIYNNDPACNLSIVPNCQEEEDVYIVPDS